MGGSFPYLSRDDEASEITVVFDLCTAYWFSESGSDFLPLYGAKQTLRFDYGNCQFIFADCNGDVWHFTETGEYKKDLPANNDARKKEVTRSSPDGLIEEISRSVIQNGRTITDSNIFEYITSGENAGCLRSATSQRSTNPTIGIRRMVYEYYGSGEEHGSLGDLKTATEQILAGTVWVDHETSYYRYYKAGQPNGFAHGLKYALGAQAFDRLKRDPQVADPFLATDAQVAKYADNYFEYNGDHRVTKSVTRGGLLTYLFAYTVSGHSNGYNNWKLKVVMTRPDASQLITFNNYLGQTMLTDLASGSEHWLEYHQFDGEAHEILHASPSAVVSYNEATANLGVVLRTSAGLIWRTDYYATTTATPTTADGAAGYVQFQKLSQGTSGTPIKQSETKYIQRPTSEVTIYPVAESTVFRNIDGSGTITTGYAFNWFSGTAQMQQRTTTLPVVPGSQNGTNTTDTLTDIFDDQGNLIWQRDARGFITNRTYDLPTGALLQLIQDVNGSIVTLPSGWSTPAGGGLNLVTDNEIDALGRTTQSLGPVHDVQGQSVRTASWTVYRDLNDETYSGQGYALGIGPEYHYTLINPVTIQRTSEDGRTQETIVAVRDCSTAKPCDCFAPEAGAVETPGRLYAGDCFPQANWVRWSSSFTDDHDQQVASRTYHCIPAHGPGALGINYDETLYGYDVMARQNRTVDATGTIDRTVFNVRGQTIALWSGTNDRGATDSDPSGGGTSGNNMVQISGNEYDGGAASGDGNLSQQIEYVDASTTRVTNFEYDFRNRLIITDGEIDYYETLTYDNLSQVTRRDRRNTNAVGNLIARSETDFDNRGAVYRTRRYAVNPSNGSVGNNLVDNVWHDAGSNVICSLPAGSQAFSKTLFDGLRRPKVRYVGYTPSDPIVPGSVAGDVIFEQSETQYDSTSNVVFATARQRWDNATGTGPLQGPSGSEPRSRDSYQAFWQDGISRQIASANYGTNDNAGPPMRSDTPPDSTNTLLVKHTSYNERGEAFETRDAAGQVNRSYSDDAGRTVQTIQNYVSALVRGNLFLELQGMVGTAQNVVTEMRYGPGSLLRELVALNPATGPQVTRYEHGVTLGESAVASNRLLRAEIYPDAADSADRISYAWNRQGQRTRMTDQNGTVHEYEYDLLGRPTADKVPALGSGVDAAVQRIDTTYEVRGMVKKVTSYSDPNALSAVNEVYNDYNSFTQLSAQYQVHDGSMSSGSAQVVQYAYESGATNTIRPTYLYYPSSQYVNYRYDDEASNKLSRVEALQLNGQEVCRYSYLGLSTFVTTAYPEPQIEYNFATGSGADRYAGLDRFGRVLNALWQYTGDSGSSSSGSGPAALVDLQYGYDRASNRIHRKDLVARSFDQGYDELYEYDGLNRLQKFHRGRLTDDNRTIEAPQLQQGWVLDATGNWQNFTQNDQADPSQTLDQQRVSNRVNEITQIARTVGQQWLTPQYSRTGNMTVIPKTEEPTAGMAALYDAWNRLMQLDNPSSNCAYDGLNRRITKANAAEERHYYYSTAWQILEERREGSASGSSSSSSGPLSSLDRLYVWGLRYIDDLILRDWQLESSPQRNYALQDANWNVVALTDASGGVAERYSYTAYGVPMFLNADFTAKAGSDYDWDVLYASYKWDAESGMYQVRYRWLQPILGEWATRDPSGYDSGILHLLLYVHNSPLMLSDSYGLAAENTPPADLCQKAQDYPDKAGNKAAKYTVDYINDPKNKCTCSHDPSAPPDIAEGYITCNGGKPTAMYWSKEAREKSNANTGHADCDAKCGIEASVLCHEQQHVIQVGQINANVCKGVMDGGHLKIDNDDCIEVMECYAYKTSQTYLYMLRDHWKEMAKKNIEQTCTFNQKETKCSSYIYALILSKGKLIEDNYKCKSRNITMYGQPTDAPTP